MNVTTAVWMVLLASATHCSAGQPPSAALGINLAGPADWNTELPFVDVFRMSRPWISQREGTPWGQGPPLETDALGWVTRLQPDCYAETMLCTIQGGHFPGGIYTVLYDGDGELGFGGSARIVTHNPGQVQIAVLPERGGFSLQVRRTNPDDYVRNIRVIMPGFVDTWKEHPFHPTFLKRWQGMTCVRFMDWMHTNGSEVVTWSDRPTLAHATFSRRGVAAEWMIDLCNRLGADPWFCIPHQADDDFVRRFATLVHDQLNPDRKVYVEYSNEVWNGQFAQHHYAREQGRRRGLAAAGQDREAGWRFTAVRSLEIFAIWEDVFGGRERLVRVLPSQAASTHVSEQVLSFRDAWKSADVLAIAPYMSCTVGHGQWTDAEQIAEWNVDELLDAFAQRSLPQAVERMRSSMEVARKYGLRLVAYEAGQHMVCMAGDDLLTERITETMHAANRHPRMGKIYDQYYAAWTEIGGGTLVHFSSIGGWSRYGSWGLMPYQDSPPQDFSRFTATMQWARRLGQDVHGDK